MEGLPPNVGEWLGRIQNDLFDVGADLSVPEGGDRERLRVAPEQTEWLEQVCDEVLAGLEPLRSFVLPGGTPAAAQLHVAGRSAGGPSGAFWPSAMRRLERSCATSTGSPICCSFSPGRSTARTRRSGNQGAR